MEITGSLGLWRLWGLEVALRSFEGSSAQEFVILTRLRVSTVSSIVGIVRIVEIVGIGGVFVEF